MWSAARDSILTNQRRASICLGWQWVFTACVASWKMCSIRALFEDGLGRNQRLWSRIIMLVIVCSSYYLNQWRLHTKLWSRHSEKWPPFTDYRPSKWRLGGSLRHTMLRTLHTNTHIYLLTTYICQHQYPPPPYFYAQVIFGKCLELLDLYYTVNEYTGCPCTWVLISFFIARKLMNRFLFPVHK